MARNFAASALGASLFGQAGAFVVPAPAVPQRDTRLRGSSDASATFRAAEQGAAIAGASFSARSLALGFAGGFALAVAAATGRGRKQRAPRVAKAASPAEATNVKVGDAFPDVSLDKGFPPEKVSMKEFCKGKKVVLVGLPGAFTPTWSSTQVPGYLLKEDDLKAKGVSDVVVYCVNDGAVMMGWAKDQGVEGSIISFMGDPRSEVTNALGLVLDHPGPMSVLGTPRCKRFSMLIDDGVIKTINVAAAEDDPAGDDNPTVSLVDKMLADLQ